MNAASKILHWAPRMLCILAIIFISMFAADSFSPELTFWQQMGGFLIHLIPSFILIIILAVAWKWELAGGILFTVIGLILSPVIYKFNYNSNHSVGISLGVILAITFPFIVTGILFIVGHYFKKKRFLHTDDQE